MKKKLLIVSSSLDTGGAQKMISNITTALPEEWETDILLNTNQHIQFAYNGNIISLNVAEPKSRTNLWYQAQVLFKRLYMLRRLKKKNHYQACISLLDSANVANIITGKKHCKVIITAVINMSESAHIKAYKYVVFPLIRLFYNKASHIVAQNNAIRDDLVSHFGIHKELFTIIYNGIDGQAIEEICKRPLSIVEKEWYQPDRTFITAGRLTYAKGQWHLIRAFKKVLEQIPDAKLVIFGVGELEAYLKRLVKEYRLEKSIRINGFNNELDKYIAASAAFVFPSMLEGMPTVLLEAMACEVPSIITDFQSGAREILDFPAEEKISNITKTQYGIITPLCSDKMEEADVLLEKNEEILAEAMTEILQNSDMRNHYAKMGKKRSKDFDMKNIINNWIALIEK